METKKLLAICGIIIIICLIIAVGTYSITTNNTKNTTIANNTSNINNTTNNTTNISNSPGTVKDTSSQSSNSNSKVSDSSSRDSSNYEEYWLDENGDPHDAPDDPNHQYIHCRYNKITQMDEYDSIDPIQGGQWFIWLNIVENVEKN